MSHAEELVALREWVANHAGETMTLELAATVPACLGYYPVVTANSGIVTGKIADADDPAYSLFCGDDRFCCVFRD